MLNVSWNSRHDQMLMRFLHLSRHVYYRSLNAFRMYRTRDIDAKSLQKLKFCSRSKGFPPRWWVLTHVVIHHCKITEIVSVVPTSYHHASSSVSFSPWIRHATHGINTKKPQQPLSSNIAEKCSIHSMVCQGEVKGFISSIIFFNDSKKTTFYRSSYPIQTIIMYYTVYSLNRAKK